MREKPPNNWNLNNKLPNDPCPNSKTQRKKLKTQNWIKTNISYQTQWDMVRKGDVTETNIHNINEEMSEANSLTISRN